MHYNHHHTVACRMSVLNVSFHFQREENRIHFPFQCGFALRITHTTCVRLRWTWTRRVCVCVRMIMVCEPPEFSIEFVAANFPSKLFRIFSFCCAPAKCVYSVRCSVLRSIIADASKEQLLRLPVTCFLRGTKFGLSLPSFSRRQQNESLLFVYDSKEMYRCHSSHLFDPSEVEKNLKIIPVSSLPWPGPTLLLG